MVTFFISNFFERMNENNDKHLTEIVSFLDLTDRNELNYFNRGINQFKFQFERKSKQKQVFLYRRLDKKCCFTV